MNDEEFYVLPVASWRDMLLFGVVSTAGAVSGVLAVNAVAYDGTNRASLIPFAAVAAGIGSVFAERLIGHPPSLYDLVSTSVVYFFALSFREALKTKSIQIEE